MSSEEQLRKALRKIRATQQNHDPEDTPTNAAAVIYRIEHIISELESLSQILIVDLINRIDKHYDEEELRQLAFTLNTDYDALPGRSQRLKIRHMVQFIMKDRRLDDLYAQLQQERPGHPWTL